MRTKLIPLINLLVPTFTQIFSSFPSWLNKAQERRTEFDAKTCKLRRCDATLVIDIINATVAVCMNNIYLAFNYLLPEFVFWNLILPFVSVILPLSSTILISRLRGPNPTRRGFLGLLEASSFPVNAPH